jgi:hypothetical protein
MGDGLHMMRKEVINMFNILFSTILTILAILGLIEVFRIITLICLRTKDESSVIIVVPIKGHNEQAEFLLRSAAARLKWLGAVGKQKVLCVDMNMDAETRKICEIIKREYQFIDICFSDEFEKSIAKNIRPCLKK